MGRSLAVALVLVVVILAGAAFVYLRVVAPTNPSPTLVVHGADAGPVTASATHASPSASPDAGPAAPQNAEIVAARGAVQARTGEKGPWTEAEVGQKLGTDDAVRAGRNAEATLRMGNGVEVRLSPRSEFTIRELSEGVSKIRLEEGHVTASVDENGHRSLKVAARGTDAEAESKGGEFGVVTDGKGQLAVATTTGSVKLSAAGQTVDVAAGQTSASVAGAAPSAPKAIPASLFLKVSELGNTKTKETSVTLTGVTEPGSLVKSGDSVGKVDERGHFRVQVPLKDGDNTVAVDVTDASGRTKTEKLPTIVVDRKKPQIEATTKWGTPAPPQQN